MTIIVEDGTQVTNANSYVTEAEAEAYALARGITLVTDTEQLIIRSMDYLESLQFKGIKVQSDQALQWPRANVTIDGYFLNIDEIPDELKNGLIEIVMATDNSQDPLADIPRTKSKVTVGPISVDYTQGSSSTTIVRKINAALYKLLKDGSLSGISFVVSRG